MGFYWISGDLYSPKSACWRSIEEFFPFTVSCPAAASLVPPHLAIASLAVPSVDPHDCSSPPHPQEKFLSRFCDDQCQPNCSPQRFTVSSGYSRAHHHVHIRTTSVTTRNLFSNDLGYCSNVSALGRGLVGARQIGERFPRSQHVCLKMTSVMSRFSLTPLAPCFSLLQTFSGVFGVHRP